MKLFIQVAVVSLILVAGSTGWSVLHQPQSTTPVIAKAAQAFLDTLDDQQKQQAVFEYAAKERKDWHFIPKKTRKGMQVKEMNEAQKKAANAVLRSCLSKAGYDKARKIMELEKVLAALEKNKTGGAVRDSERYYITLFGKPGGDDLWGISFEGHHLSLNFSLKGSDLVSSTPSFFAANPATVKSQEVDSVPLGTQVLKDEEQIAFELVNSLDEAQRKSAVIAEKAPREIRGAGEAETPKDEKVGIVYSDLNEEQKEKMRELVRSYLIKLPPVAVKRLVQKITADGSQNIRFAWAGATKPGIGHYYRIQGPSLLIEFVNTQPDPAGNPANHIHCVLRELSGDFGP